jgi:hypothetical protein
MVSSTASPVGVAPVKSLLIWSKNCAFEVPLRVSLSAPSMPVVPWFRVK